ncbi:hypothetical protein ACLI1A_03980 [Flavobacterium sp. RHBU_3]|uniref:hypothetical protein n=1 Tax=Flavobacterium sp. RHBU_3 TaxID=3391184 RepID=UPI00398542AE
MLKNAVLWLLLFCAAAVHAQQVNTPYKTRRVLPVHDTIHIDSVSVNPGQFSLKDAAGKEIDSTLYSVDFAKAIVVFKNGYTPADSLQMGYLAYPDFLTKKYSLYDRSRVVPNDAVAGQRYSFDQGTNNILKPLSGLNTSGSITRGITVGNNQNAVVNSNLDLQITGKLSDKVSLRASIQDTNIPIQDGGYSQKLDEFDQIFIEMFSDKWAVRAGDLFLENRQSKFLNFSKKVQGLNTTVVLGTPEHKTTITAAAALVRGQYARSTFTGTEGNQGPYKLTGNNGELYVLVISGSERVYVNGVLLERGESNDYVIDYNAGEVTFTSLFPITSEMRINVEYQYSNQNFSRFVTYGGVTHDEEDWSIGTYVYSESDMKNQPQQQSLTAEQVAVLQGAGDDSSLMVAPSGYVDTYSENKVLYKKETIDGIEVYVYSNNPDDELYNVTFTNVGTGLGNYVVSATASVSRIYEYVAPIAGVPQGSYEPVIKLTAPAKIQIATVMGKYNPGEKTLIDFEAGISNNDLNLYSPIDDNNNQGTALRLNAKQRIFTQEKWMLDAFANYQFVQKDFRTIERLFNIEFSRDWNLTNVVTTDFNQSYLVAGTTLRLPKNGQLTYQAEKLDFGSGFSGTRHVLNGQMTFKKLYVQNTGSMLKSDGNYSTSSFVRNEALAKYHFGKNWAGSSFRAENNEEKLKETGAYSTLSQRFTEYGAFIGRGDSTKVYVELGYLQRANDSLVEGLLKRVNTSRSYYLKSRLLKTDKSDLTVFVNYRKLKFTDPAYEDQPSLNSRLLYNDRYWGQLLQVTTAYETASGTIAQQEFTYVEVAPGQGVYMWNDYNGDGIQQLQEFEVAPYSDLAIYVRVYLPSQVYIGTHQNKFSQSVTFNPVQWQNETGFKKLLSYFYDQASYIIDRKIERSGNGFDLNPFSSSDENLLGLSSSLRNSVFYNRGKQDHSVTYTYLNSRSRSLLSVGSQDGKLQTHQLQYAHLIQKTWLASLSVQESNNTSAAENYESKNYDIDSYQLAPKLSYIFSKNASLDIFFEYQNRKNTITGMEQLDQKRIGTSFSYASPQGSFTTNGEFSLYKNDFTGEQTTAAGYQMLQGLTAGQNLTWRLLLQKSLTRFLDMNISYQGRKSETSKTIHTGSVQLRAYF